MTSRYVTGICRWCKGTFDYKLAPGETDRIRNYGVGFIAPHPGIEGSFLSEPDPDEDGKRWLLEPIKPGEVKDYYGQCPKCREEGRIAAEAWNRFMGREGI